MRRIALAALLALSACAGLRPEPLSEAERALRAALIAANAARPSVETAIGLDRSGAPVELAVGDSGRVAFAVNADRVALVGHTHPSRGIERGAGCSAPDRRLAARLHNEHGLRLYALERGRLFRCWR